MYKNIDILKSIMEEELSCSAHNIDHVMRVYNLCEMIGETEENVDKEVLLSAAILHDIARVKESEDTTGQVDHAVLGSEMAEEILSKLEYGDDSIAKIKHCIKTHRYRSGNVPESIEAKILFDADKLDAIGAVGIARTFMLAGQFGQQIFSDADIENHEENAVDNGRLKDMSKHTPMMEYEIKLRKIPKKLHTAKAKEIGGQRIEFMDTFFDRLKEEVSGKL